MWHLGRLRSVGPVQTAEHVEEDWENAWKAHFVPVRASDRVVIRPPWHAAALTDGDIEVILDPGMAFGTGTHPTTRLCLNLLEAWLDPGQSMLDAGTGTGILAIAAAKLGASTVTAIDIDPVAVRQATKNVQLNDLSNEIRVVEGALVDSPGTFDIVVANIISRVLIDLALILSVSRAPGRPILLSGIIEDKEDAVTAEFSGLGLRQVERLQMGDWLAHVWR
jgi:ribosomal protein L11 methyltransferase